MPLAILAVLISLGAALADSKAQAANNVTAATGRVGVVAAEQRTSALAAAATGRADQTVHAAAAAAEAKASSIGSVGAEAPSAPAGRERAAGLKKEGSVTAMVATATGGQGRTADAAAAAKGGTAGEAAGSGAVRAEASGSQASKPALAGSAAAGATAGRIGEVAAESTQRHGRLRGGFFACLSKLQHAGFTKDLYFCDGQEASGGNQGTAGRASCCAGTFQAYCTPSHSFCASEGRMPRCDALFRSCRGIL